MTRGKKLKGNGLAMSSRIILPEMRAKHEKRLEEKLQRNKVELDEQQQALISDTIKGAHIFSTPVTLTVFYTLENRQISGLVTFIDMRLRRVKIESDEGYEWVELEDILHVEDLSG